MALPPGFKRVTTDNIPAGFKRVRPKVSNIPAGFEVVAQRDIKPVRFGKQIINTISRTAKEVFLGVGGEKIGSFIMASALNKRLKKRGIKPPSLLETRKRVQAAMRGELKKVAPEFEIAPATTVGEKATDIAAGVTGFVAELVALKKVFPASGGRALWEIQNLSSGGTPGVGAATYSVFNLPGKVIKGTTLAAKAGRLGSESALLAATSAIHQKIETGEINATEVLISAGIPIGLKAAGGAKGVLKRALKAKNPKAIKAVNEALDIPLGSNVYKTKSGKIVIEKPSEIGNPKTQKTILKNGKVIEKSTGKELTLDTELSPSGILDAPAEVLSKPTELASTNKQLLDWSKKAKVLRKTQVEPAVHKLRQRQAARGTSLLRRKLKSESAFDAIQQSQLGYKDKANIPDVTPPNLSELQWEGYARKILKVFPASDARVQFQRTDTLKALTQLKNGKIPTNRQFELLEPIFGEKTVESLYGNLIKKRKFSGWEIPALAVQAGKSIFSLDVQTIRQARSAAGRHPGIFAKSAWANVKGYASQKQANKIAAELKASPGYAESAKTLNYISTKGYKQGARLEQFSLGLTERLLNARFKTAVLDKSAGAGLRTYGKVVHASERGAAAGINKMMKSLWDIGQKQLAQIPNLTPAQKQAWTLNRSKTINTFMKILRSKNPQARTLQHAANFLLFSPSVTAARPLSIKALVANKGSRGYAAEIGISNIASIAATVTIPALIANHLRMVNPTEEPNIDGGLNPLQGDFGKVRVGGTVYDFTGGDAPFYRTLVRIGVSSYLKGQEAITGKSQGTAFGTTIPSVADTLLQYGKTRETAILGFGKTMLTGKDWLGQDIPRLEATIRAFTPEVLQATIEAGMADGTWAALAGGIATASSAGVDTYPISSAKTRKEFRNIIAQQEHNKPWDGLNQRQQLKLNIKHRKELEVFTKKIAVERESKAFDPKRIIEEEVKAGKRIYKMLTKKNKSLVKGVSLAISRRPSKFYLNDKRYQLYQKLIAKNLNERLSKLKIRESMREKTRDKIIEINVRLAKEKALRELKKSIRNG